MDFPAAPGTPTSVRARARLDRRSWWLFYGGVLFVTLIVGAIAVSTAQQPFSLALVIMLLGAVVALVRPVAGIYLVALFALVGDVVTSGWYPFTWNFSTRTSILFIADGIILSPLDIYVASLMAGWLLQMMATRRWHLVRGPLFWPVMAFTGFLVFGFVYGVFGKGGGDINAALWEFRPLLYMPALYLLATNLFTRREQYRRLIWFVMVAVCITSILAIFYYNTLTPMEFEDMESLVTHPATIPMNAMFILFIGGFLFKRSQSAIRWLLPLMAVPVMVVYLLSQRRAAIVGLVGGIIMVFAVMKWVKPKVFWRVAPVVLVLGAAYVGAFWTSDSSAGFPAQAVKSVVAADETSERNQGSDQYRDIENYDIVYTIKSSPLLGVGFGHAFLKPYPLPAISSFLLVDLKPHNSILWIWLKAGVAGFIAMLVLFGKAIATGARNILENPNDGYSAFSLMSAAYVLMFAIFAYVDITWEAQNMVLLGLLLAQIDSVKRLTPPPPPEDSVEAAPAEPALVASPA